MDEKTEQAAEEQIRQQCVFCQIIAGKINSRRIYEDDLCVAILDINPANPGHTLLMPKEHYAIMPMIPVHIIEHLFKVAKKISFVQIRALEAQGTTIFSANGPAAGQKAPHFMIHIIPRKENDGITAFNLPKNRIAEQDQEKLRLAISSKLGEQALTPAGSNEKKPVSLERPKQQRVETTIPHNPMQQASTKKEERNMNEQIESEKPEDLFKLEEPDKPEEAERIQEPDKIDEGLTETTEEEELTEQAEMFRLPSPEEAARNAEQEEEKELKPKKKFNLDMISDLFK